MTLAMAGEWIGGAMNSADSAGSAEGLRADVGDRWRHLDALLPQPGPLPPGCGARLTVPGPDGQLVAAASCEHWHGDPRSLDVTWGAAVRFELTAQVSTASLPGTLDELLSRWRAHLDGVPGARAADTAAVVTWPSRDVEGVKVLMTRGLAPMAVIAARRTPAVAGSDQAGPSAASERAAATAVADVTIRRARPADLADAVELGLEVIRYDTQVSSVTMRPETPGALERELAGMLGDPDPWVWMAERAGSVIGMLATEKPDRARWIADRAGPGPVAYLMLAGTTPDQRGTGVGAAMVRHLHQEVQAAGVPVILLHHGVANPLSSPFWYQQGYRPLWTVWEAAPAAGFG
jgi:ribosomal protein S18 acetylase RimI-like enzyme